MIKMDDLQRYSRQIVLPEIGEDGQRKLHNSSVAIVGCGALGTHIADSLVRAGVGRLRLIDRDFVELNNLQRQCLFNEADVAQGMPKTIAAADKLRLINSQVAIEPFVADINPGNIEQLVGNVDLILDGTDNFEIRMLINDLCLRDAIPWVYGGVIGTTGMSMVIIPGKTPCLRCLVETLPPPGSMPTCDTVGVLGPAAAIIAAVEVTQGMKLLLGIEEDIPHTLYAFDIWQGEFDRLKIGKGEGPCPACDLGRYEFLTTKEGSWVTSLCGRDAVQIRTTQRFQITFSELAERLKAVGEVTFNDYMLRLRVDTYEVNLFPDGRAIIKGCNDPALGRTLYAKFIGV